ncbi:MAG: RagB/SusD family nutrient uptake outer membrane protein, partial [Tissierellia bacterium]|nr:RagB/SusD family nutrient uptake outer membrane protein [Tissierellia bacterium]
MKGKILMLFSLLIISLGSCESFLDLKPQGKTIPKTPEEYSAMIHQMIFDIENEKGGFIMQGTTDIIDTEAISDNLDANIYLGQEMIPFYVGQRLNQTIYSKLYQNIRNCNIILDGLEDDETDYGLKVRSAA